MSFLVVVCGKYGGLLLAKAGQKTRTCPTVALEWTYAGQRRLLQQKPPLKLQLC